MMTPEGWPTGKYGVLLVDPPWHYKAWSASGTGRSAEQHYSVMSMDDIKALPVASLAAKDCVLLLWATYPLLPEAFDTIKAWDFTFKTVAFTWAKMTRGSTANMFAPKWHIGNGHWTRSNAELCLLATKGKPTRLARNVRQLIVAPVRQHSRKPDEQYDRIERLLPGPFCELFCRGAPQPGWIGWGNECTPRSDD